ncbi:hypothetical protein O181_006744 [Austropuccinia psidii MF-1]|uniref:Reverse transcriptase Ty1/copia-type domain-containing protein n=1 Tax=Austropuccinia psidii MF-1 TaxID=1389203 RepID=A0A9Q3BKM3_9BASI|nr:hypothetical protein [Austropuccinia psidii MF-1]
MRQAGRCWWIFLSGILTWMGFSAMEVDQSLYIFCSGETIITIWVHVEDGVVTSNSATAMSDFKCQLCSKVVKRDSPLPVLPQPSSAKKVDVLDMTAFRLVVGSLAYLISGSRPDLAFVVSLNLWSNAGWGGNLKQSQTRFMLKLGNTPILWCSKRQGAVALSTCAVEYVTLSDSTQNLVQAICQLTHLTNNFDKMIFCDNQAAVQISIDNLSRKQMRYLDHAFFCE